MQDPVGHFEKIDRVRIEKTKQDPLEQQTTKIVYIV